MGTHGAGNVRVALANRPEVHEQGLERLRAGLAQIDLLRHATIASPPHGVFDARPMKTMRHAFWLSTMIAACGSVVVAGSTGDGD
jgi:hypothetical protein